MQQSFMGTVTKCYPMTEGDGRTLLTTCAPTGVKGLAVQEAMKIEHDPGFMGMIVSCMFIRAHIAFVCTL